MEMMYKVNKMVSKIKRITDLFIKYEKTLAREEDAESAERKKTAERLTKECEILQKKIKKIYRMMDSSEKLLYDEWEERILLTVDNWR